MKKRKNLLNRLHSTYIESKKSLSLSVFEKVNHFIWLMLGCNAYFWISSLFEFNWVQSYSIFLVSLRKAKINWNENNDFHFRESSEALEFKLKTKPHYYPIELDRIEVLICKCWSMPGNQIVNDYFGLFVDDFLLTLSHCYNIGLIQSLLEM